MAAVLLIATIALGIAPTATATTLSDCVTHAPPVGEGEPVGDCVDGHVDDCFLFGPTDIQRYTCLLLG